MSKFELSALVAEYLARGGKVQVLPEGIAAGADALAKWSSDRLAPVGRA